MLGNNRMSLKFPWKLRLLIPCADDAYLDNFAVSISLANHKNETNCGRAPGNKTVSSVSISIIIIAL